MNSLNKKMLPMLVALALGTGLPAASVAAQARQDDGATETVILQPARKMTERQAALISENATKVLVQIAEARGALRAGDRPRAEKALGRARALLALIRRERPTEKIIDRVELARKHLEYEEAATVAADLVPVYADLTLVEDLVPVDEAKAQLGKAREALAKGDRKTARKALTVLQESLIYTEVDLPVSSTGRNILAAQKALAAGDLKKAEKALKAAESGMVFLSVEVVSPLARARDDLYLARREYAAGHYDQAGKALAEANRWLDLANRDTPPNMPAGLQRLEVINDMKRQIDELAVNMGRHEQKKGVGRRLEGLWHKLASMVETEVESAFTGHGPTPSQADIRPRLIKVKQHVAFAENLQFYAKSDPADIFKALDDARAELESALGDEPGNVLLKQLLEELASLRKMPDQRELYDSIRGRLRKMIHQRS
ncbi:YfdX family protein [Thiolapillus sp.]